MRGDFLDMSACRIFYAAKEHCEHFITKRYWTPLSLTDDVLDLYMTSYYMETNNVGGGKKIVSNEENEYKRDLFKKYMVQFPTFCIFDIIDTDDSIEDDAHQDPQRYEVIAALTLEQDVKLYKDEQQFSIIHFGAVKEGSKYSSHFMTLLYKVVKNFKLQRYPMIYVTSPGRLRYDDNNNEDQLPYNKLLNYSFRPKKVDTLLQDLLEIKSEVIVGQGVSVDINFKNKILVNDKLRFGCIHNGTKHKVMYQDKKYLYYTYCFGWNLLSYTEEIESHPKCLYEAKLQPGKVVKLEGGGSRMKNCDKLLSYTAVTTNIPQHFRQDTYKKMGVTVCGYQLQC